MKKKMVLLTLAVLVVGMTAPVAALGNRTPEKLETVDGRPQRINVLVGFRQAPGRYEQALIRSHSGTIKYTYHLVPAIAANLPEPAIEALLSNPRVANVELDGTVQAVGTELDNSWGVKRIGSGAVHDDENKGTGVKIGIIDSGVDYTHSDLNDNYIGGYDFVDGDDNPMDVYGHGTHVAGSACAEDNDNGIDDETGKFGVVGVAPECALYSLRVLNESGSGYWSDIIAAVEWAVDENLQIVNLSLGSSKDPGQTVRKAFDNAEAAGLLTVAAAGNDGNPPGRGNNVIYPAKYDSVIAVAAIDSDDQRASWSSTGEQVELAAPGVSVYSTWNDDSSHYDPQPVCRQEEGKTACYKYGSGTSMASPHVAGTGALVIAAGITDTNGDGRINDEVREVIDSTADDLGDTGRDEHYGFGLVNAAAAVGAVVPPEPITDIAVSAVEAPSSVVQGDTTTVEVTVENVGNQDVISDITVTLTDKTDDVTINTQTISGGLAAGVSETLTFWWDTTEATLGDHTLIASHGFTDDDSTNDTRSTTVTVSETVSTMHVGDLDGQSVKLEKGNWKALVTVTVHDASEQLVGDATVEGTFYQNGTLVATVSCTTAADGTCTVDSGQFPTKSGKARFEVDNVTHGTLSYDATANHDPDGDSDGTSITLSK